MRKSVKMLASNRQEQAPTTEENDEEGHQSNQAEGDTEEGHAAQGSQLSEQISERSEPEPVTVKEQAQEAEDRLESTNLEVSTGP